MRILHLLGVPLRSGSLYPGNENDAQAYRDSTCSIRSWPGPRIVWDCVSDRVAKIVEAPRPHIPLLIGCDCSVVVGSAQALARQAPPGGVHVLYIDGDFDDAAPDAKTCRSAAAVAVWLLTNESPFWAGPILSTSQVTVIGPSAAPAGRSAVERAAAADTGPRDSVPRSPHSVRSNASGRTRA